MNRLILIFILSITTIAYSSVDTRLTLVSNTAETPSSTQGTMVIKVQAQSSTSTESISGFQGDFKLDNTFQAQNPSVTFSNQLFTSSNYNVNEDYFSGNGKVQYVYSFDSGTRSIIGTGWTDVLTVTIVYDMDNTKETTISWDGSIPDYRVLDENSQDITGSEVSIPPELQNIPLPVELTSFYSMVTDTKVKLFWETATEVQNSGFQVQRALDVDEKDWQNLGFVPGNGNSNSPKKYSYEDNNISGGNKFVYRLKQIDTDNSFEYSDEIVVELDLEAYSLEQNYPNPFNPATVIKFSIPEDQVVKLDVFNIIGQKVATLVNGYLEKGFYKMNFDARNYGDELSSGIYIYKLETPSFTQTKKMILVK